MSDQQVANVARNLVTALNTQLVEKLRRALEPFTFDGTEIFRTIDIELPGPENEIAAANLRHAALAQYRDCIPRDAVLEVVCRAVERTWAPADD
jgi:hypothetical protein